MKVYREIVKGNTILLEEKPDLPDDCQALVEFKPLDKARDEEITRQQVALLKNLQRRKTSVPSARGTL